MPYGGGHPIEGLKCGHGKGYAAAISTISPAVTSARTADALLCAASDGRQEILGVLDGTALLLVELDSGDELTAALPAWLPCVVVALCRRSQSGSAPVGADMALCPGSSQPGKGGWVTVPDVDTAVSQLATEVAGRPHPSVVLAQVLRTSAGLDIAGGLVVESAAYSTLQAGPDFASWLKGRKADRAERRDEPADAVVVERRESQLMVTLNRPHVRNAVDRRMRDGLCEALAVAAADPSITSVELRGAGPDFSSGGDLDEFGTSADPVAGHLTRTVRSPARMMAAVADRVTAHLHGACVGAGVELAAFAGRVVADPDTSCRLPEVSLGLIPGSGGTVSIPRRIGRQRTAWLGISGETIDATTAGRWGLVDEIVTAG